MATSSLILLLEKVSNSEVKILYLYLVFAVICAISGILAFALPIPAIIVRFQEHQEHVAGEKMIKDPDEQRKIMRSIFMNPMKHE